MYINQKMIGTVRVEKVGLYYKICCRFKGRLDRKMHLHAISSDGLFDLGACSQHGREIGIDRVLPIKTVGNTIIRFCVSTDNSRSEIPVQTGMVFHAIDRLMDAVLIVESGNVRIKIGYSM